VLFEKRLQNGLRDGSIRLAFRRWRRAQVVGGRHYRSPIGLIDVQTISIVDGPISPEDAQAAGYPSVDSLLKDMTGPPDGRLYRIELKRSSELDLRQALAQEAALSDADFKQLSEKLARLDKARAWTLSTLEAIETRPGTRAGDLASDLGWSELLEFKLHVRKLKALGLTLSLLVGYRLAPRGEAYLRTVRAARSAR
jgi:hypothetical protein